VSSPSARASDNPSNEKSSALAFWVAWAKCVSIIGGEN